MIQKRSNPLDLNVDPELTVEEKPVVKATKPVDKAAKPVAKPKVAKPVIKETINAADFKHDFKKRTNPLELNQVEVAKKEVVAKPVVLPTTINGNNQRKFIITKVNKLLLTSLMNKTGKAKPELLDAALLQYAFNNHKDLYKEIVDGLKKLGGEVK